MIRVAITVALISLAAPATAREVVIKSGEHADFSRLVLYFDAPTEWRLGRIADGYRLEPMEPNTRFDTSQVFDFLPRTRLLEVRKVPEGLDLEVTCECHANAFEYRPGIVVIDIKDGAARPGGQFETVLDTPEDRPAPIAGPTRHVSVRMPTGGAGTFLQLPITFPDAVPAGHTPPPAPPPTPEPVPDTGAALRAELGEGIGRAVAYGLATPRDPDAHATGERSGNSAAVPGIDVRSGVEIATGTAPAEDAARSACLDGAIFDVTAWGAASPTPLAALEAARANFLKDFVEPTDAAVLDLARTYVYLGFGAEAVQLLAAYPIGDPAGAVTAALARVVDNPEQPGPQVLRTQTGCDTPAALWALLAMPTADLGTAIIDSKAILRSLSAMPLHLRRQLAPAVSERLRRAGHGDEAQAARETLFRATNEPGAELEVEEARAEGDAAAPEVVAAVEDAARGNEPVALAAQTELLTRLARNRTPVVEEKRHEVEAQIHESKGSPESADLVDAYVAALASSAAYDDALALLARLRDSGHAGTYDLSGDTNRVMQAVTADPSEGTFLVEARAFAAGPLRDLLSPEQAGEISERLTALGFLTEAEGYDDSADPRMDAHRQRALSIRALREGRPSETLARLASQTDDEAMRLKADALMELGAYPEAAQAYESLDERELAADAYWQAGLWRDAERLTMDAQRKRIAALLIGEAPAPLGGVTAADGTAQLAAGAGTSGGVPTLAEASGWIDQSEALRTFAQDVLNAAASPQ
ncbi:MAG: hypothetical protein KDA73_01455 [Rhodobacteraceae bacterium]|nr:hypothetical protein [Paracoccaceae bacterium]